MSKENEVEVVTPLVNRTEVNMELNGHQVPNGFNNIENKVTVEMSELPFQHQTSTMDAEDSFGNLLNTCTASLKSCRKWTRKRVVDILYISSFLLYAVYIAFVIDYDPSNVLISLLDATLFLLFVVHRFMKLQDIARVVTKPLVVQAKRRCRIHPSVRRYFRR